MTDTTEALRPTPERLSKADHLIDDGSATKEKPYIRAQRLGTAWDRYSRTRNRNGNVLADSEMLLTRAQIAAGEQYAKDYEAGMWGQARVSQFEPAVSGATTGVPASRIEKRKAVWRAEASLTKHEPAMLQSVIFDGVEIEDWARRMRRFDEPDPLTHLRKTLDKLAEHYGYAKESNSRKPVGGKTEAA